MSTTAIDMNAGPALAGALPASGEKRPKAGGRGDGLVSAVPAGAYEEPIYKGRTISGRYWVVSDPVAVRRVLVENAANYPKTKMDLGFFAAIFGGGLLGLEGDDWRRHRRIMAPAFDPRSVAAYGPAMAQSLANFLAGWDGLPDRAEVDFSSEMTSLALEVISRAVFSSASREMMELVRHTLEVGFATAAQANLLDLVPIIKDLRMRARERRVAAASADLDAAIEALLAERAQMAEPPPDLLTRLLAARDAEGGGRLSGKEIRDEIVTIYIAGHETTASTLSWTFYLLSQRPQIAERLHAELDAVLGGKPPTADDLPRLTYARQVVEESMRLYPAAPGLSTRQAIAADEIGGQRIPKGAQVLVLPFVLHRHRKLWDDPECADPERFSAERSHGRPRFAYLPFGAGPRVCIGQVLAMNEIILALAAIAQRYDPQLIEGARVALHANVTLRPKFGLPMRLVRRSAQTVSASG